MAKIFNFTSSCLRVDSIVHMRKYEDKGRFAIGIYSKGIPTELTFTYSSGIYRDAMYDKIVKLIESL